MFLIYQACQVPNILFIVFKLPLPQCKLRGEFAETRITLNGINRLIAYWGCVRVRSFICQLLVGLLQGLSLSPPVEAE